jgi:protein involved in ribonucleotide reduction
MNTKQLINQEELQELKIQNNKLKCLVSEYFELKESTYLINSYLRKQQLKKKIIKLINK